uniref:Polymerase polyprotein n=1 Tax=Raspberry bushy dwarf virus TaxID=12451 RepID=A0A173N0M9_RBDV|nr:polymerase polyprotein [Raspberry bushy dwarf virus]
MECLDFSKLWFSTAAGLQQRCYYDCVAWECLGDDDLLIFISGLNRLIGSVAASCTGDEDLDFVVDSCNEFVTGGDLKSFFAADFPVREVSSVGCISHFIPGSVSGLNVSDLLDNQLYGCSVFSSDFESKLRDIRDAALSDAASGVSQLVSCHFEKDVRHLLAENANSVKIPVPQKLSDDDMRILRDHFPRYELKFTQNVDGPHNMAAAHRLLETHDLLSNFPADAPILDIGGNWFSHFRYGRSNVHSCCPLLDLRDNERHTHRLTMTESLMSSLRHRYAGTIDLDPDAHLSRKVSDSMKEFYKRWAVHPKDLIRLYAGIRDGNSSLYCHHKFGVAWNDVLWESERNNCLTIPEPGCSFKAKYAIMVHSGYDLPLKELIGGMVQHGVVELHGTMIADPAMLVATSGYIPALRCNWEKSKGQIWFSFRDDSTMGYRHDWEVYSKYLTSTVVSCGKHFYVLERDKYRHGVLFYSIIKCSGSLRKGDHTFFHNAWFHEMYDKYIMKVPLVRVKDLTGDEGSVECSWREVVMSRKLVDRVIEVCLRGVKPINFGNCDDAVHMDNLRIIQNHLLSHSQTLVLNGSTIIREEAIPFKDFSPVSVTIYFEILLTRYKESLSLAWFHAGLGPDFKLGSWVSSLKRVFYRILGFPANLLKYVLNALFRCHDKVSDMEFVKPAVEKLTVLENTYIGKSLMGDCPTLKEYDDSAFFNILENVGNELFNNSSTDSGKPEIPEMTMTGNPNVVIAEAISYCRAEVDRIGKKCERILHAYQATGNCGGYLNDTDNVGVFDKMTSWVQKPKEFDHEFGWDGSSFVKLSWFGKVPDFVGRYLVVTDGTRVMTNLKFSRQYATIPATVTPTIKLVDGVTGCGKTTEIVRRYRPGILILSVCKANVDEIRRKLPAVDSKFIRTVDSYLLSPSVTGSCDELFIDEYGLSHPGILLLAIHISGIRKVTLFGDSEQIPFCNRLADFPLKYHSVEDVGLNFDREIRSTTYRCPQDITLSLQKMYKTKPIKTVSTVESSITIKPIKSEFEIPLPNAFDGPVLYICMTKHDESLLKLRWAKENISSDVRTVHAAQGLSYKNVVYFRLTRTDNDLYTKKKLPYHLVAISRHTDKIVYCTTKPEDSSDFSLSALKNTIKTSRDLTQEASGSESSYAVVFESNSEAATTKPEVCENVRKAAEMNFPVSSDALYQKEVPIYGAIPDPKGKASYNPGSVIRAIEELTPGNTSIDTDALDELVEVGPMSLQVGSIRWDVSKISPRLFTNNKFAIPYLPTGALLRRNTSSRQVGLAIEKRNANVMNSQKYFDLENLANKAVERFFDFFIDMEKFSKLPTGVLGSSAEQIQTYQNKTGNKVTDPVCVALSPIQKYKHMIKRDVKFNLTDGAQSEYTKAATITYHQPEITQVATAIFGQFKTRLLACRNKFLNIPLEHDNDLSGYLTKYHLGSENNTFTEIDFSKFDKSQGEIHQLIQDLILIKFGCDPEFVALWSTAHRSSSIFDQNVGIGFKTDFQRRTGDAFTFLGNSLVTAAMLAFVISDSDREKIRYMLVGGDDSLICSYGPIQVPLEPLGDIFNMSCKLVQPACPYFASRYLIRRDDEILCVPDPYKLLVKLGRKDIPDNQASLCEIRTGLADSAKYIFDDIVKQKLAILVQVRYNKAAPSLYDALCTIHWALSSNTNFSKFYTVTNTSNEVRRNRRGVKIT